MPTIAPVANSYRTGPSRDLDKVDEQQSLRTSRSHHTSTTLQVLQFDSGNSKVALKAVTICSVHPGQSKTLTISRTLATSTISVSFSGFHELDILIIEVLIISNVRRSHISNHPRRCDLRHRFRPRSGHILDALAKERVHRIILHACEEFSNAYGRTISY